MPIAFNNVDGFIWPAGLPLRFFSRMIFMLVGVSELPALTQTSVVAPGP